MRGGMLPAVGSISMIGAVVLGGLSPAHAQAPAAEKRVSVAIFGQAHLGAPGQDFEDALRDATLDDPYCPLEVPGICNQRDTPVTSGGRLAYGLALGYPLSSVLELRATLRGEEDLSAYGVRQGTYRVQLSMDEESWRYALSLAYRPPMASFLYVGFGPALCDAEVRARDDWREFPAAGETRFGFVVDAGATYPGSSVFFADLGVQYWYSGDMTYGPYNVRNGLGNIQVYFPSSSYSLNRFALTLGLGVRI